MKKSHYYRHENPSGVKYLCNTNFDSEIIDIPNNGAPRIYPYDFPIEKTEGEQWQPVSKEEYQLTRIEVNQRIRRAKILKKETI